MERIEIAKNLIPYTFDILLGNKMFNIRVDYNATGNFFTLELYKDNELICSGEPLIYGVPLWRDVYISGKYPSVDIVPIDTSENATAVTFDNLNNTVFLVIDNGEGDIV